MSVRHVTARAAFGLGLMLPGGLVSGQTEQEKEPRPTELERTLSGIERIELMKRGLDSDESLQSADLRILSQRYQVKPKFCRAN